MQPVDASEVAAWMASPDRPIASPVVTYMPSPGDAFSGFDPGGWEAATWVLHAFWDSDPDAHPGARRILWSDIAAGLGLGGPEKLAEGTNGNFWKTQASLHGSAEGEMDAISADAVHNTLREFCGVSTACYAFWCGLLTMQWNQSGLAYLGDLSQVGTLMATDPAKTLNMLPNNVWPQDRSWMMATTEDSARTRISGPIALVEALESHPSLECLRCSSRT